VTRIDRPTGSASTRRWRRRLLREVYRGTVSTLRARAWDALVLLLVLSVLFEVLTTDQDVPLSLSVPVALLMTVPFIWGQRRPLPVTAVVLGAWVGQSLAGQWQQEPQSELLPVALAFWCLGAYVLPGRRAWWALGLAMLALFVHEPEDVIVLGPLMAGVFAGGRLMQSRERLAAALQNERANAERYAVAEERARIARELHDVVGHALATMTVQAGAERLALGDARPETSSALATIETTGRQALQEMRRLLGVLRSPEEAPDLSPLPGLGQLEALAERMLRSGLVVNVEVADDLRPLPPGLDVSAYRIVQEALTNVLKHADARSTRVRVREHDGVVDVEVTDDGTGVAAPAAWQGQGLTGMRERVLIHGGSLEAGPSPDGGWRVAARLQRESGP
jgi:signal transduction histidine kinase